MELFETSPSKPETLILWFLDSTSFFEIAQTDTPMSADNKNRCYFFCETGESNLELP